MAGVFLWVATMRMFDKVQHYFIKDHLDGISLIAAANIKQWLADNANFHMRSYGDFDAIYAGMSALDLIAVTQKVAGQMSSGSGHFYYAPNNSEGGARRGGLAKSLYQEGLR